MSFERDRRFDPAPFAPPGVDPLRTRQPECAKCGRTIVFVEMAETLKRMPCDPGMMPGDGRRTLVVREQVGRKLLGRVVAKAPETTTGLEPHWGTCPCRPRKVVIPTEQAPDLFNQPPADS